MRLFRPSTCKKALKTEQNTNKNRKKSGISRVYYGIITNFALHKQTTPQATMCTISQDTIIRANRQTIAKGKAAFANTGISGDGFTVSVRYNGKEYSRDISFREVRENYARALHKFK